MQRCRYVGMHVSMYVCMHACMHVCMYLCMYVYMQIYIYVSTHMLFPNLGSSALGTHLCGPSNTGLPIAQSRVTLRPHSW